MQDKHSEKPTDSDISPNSIQLQPGQKFHHCGSNGVIYFQLNVEKANDGSVYPMTRTAQACNVLPVLFDNDGRITGAYFLSQGGREEMKVGAVALKATGSFCKLGEATPDAGVRSLSEKLGIIGQREDLIFVGTSYGFGDQFQFPIDLFIMKNFTLQDSVMIQGCERVYMSLEDIAIAQRDRTFFNSETVDLILSVLLRNQFRESYEW